MQYAVGEVPAEGEGVVKPGVRRGVGSPRVEVTVGGDPVEQQPAHHNVSVVLGDRDHLREWRRVLLELVGVGEQVPAWPGELAQAVAQVGVGVLVPRPGADPRGHGVEVVGGGSRERDHPRCAGRSQEDHNSVIGVDGFSVTLQALTPATRTALGLNDCQALARKLVASLLPTQNGAGAAL